MKRMKLSELTGNEILAQSLMTWDYQIILPEGVVLKKEYISKIEEMGILEVYVKEDQANEIVILKNDIEKTIKNKVKSILVHIGDGFSVFPAGHSLPCDKNFLRQLVLRQTTSGSQFMDDFLCFQLNPSLMRL